MTRLPRQRTDLELVQMVEVFGQEAFYFVGAWMDESWEICGRVAAEDSLLRGTASAQRTRKMSSSLLPVKNSPRREPYREIAGVCDRETILAQLS